MAVQLTELKKDTQWAIDYSGCKINNWGDVSKVATCEDKFPPPKDEDGDEDEDEDEDEDGDDEDDGDDY